MIKTLLKETLDWWKDIPFIGLVRMIGQKAVGQKLEGNLNYESRPSIGRASGFCQETVMEVLLLLGPLCKGRLL